MERTFLVVAGLLGFLAVALGAFGAHGLERWLAGSQDAGKQLGWWKTGAHYHLVHAVAIGMVAWLAGRAPGTAPTVAGWAFVVGIVLFSGSLYGMTLGARWLGMITPLGGLAFLVGWAAVVWAALRMS